VYVLFHQPHILEVHFTRRVSELFDTSNLLQHVGTCCSFNFSGLNSKSSWGRGESGAKHGRATILLHPLFLSMHILWLLHNNPNLALTLNTHCIPSCSWN
jgi:hypothetical protein